MNKNLIYSCVFYNEKYINLINLLLKSYKLFGNTTDSIDYLIICNPTFKNKIKKLFNNLNINGKIWCLNLKTIFEAGYSRLKIFDYENIHLYDKILYLDCDILITNSINKILEFTLENKLYALEEGHTNKNFWGKDFFKKENPNCRAFTSGILLFNNNKIIQNLFLKILKHINKHIAKNLPIPECLDQPFIVYHAIKNNLYNNQKLVQIVVNNPKKFRGATICHFPGGPGEYKSKIVKMSNFMNKIMFDIQKNYQLNKVDRKDILCVTTSNIYPTLQMNYILKSCIFNDIKLHIIGIRKPFNWIKRLKYYINKLNNIEDDNSIVIFTDAYDVFYRDNLDIIKKKFININANIVFSCEKLYSHQVDEKRTVYDNFSKLYGNESKYRYICAGCYMGYKKDLLNLLNNILHNDFREKVMKGNGNKDNDQCLLGYYLSENYDNINFKLDYNCNIFYTPTEDWKNNNICIKNMNKFNSSIIHVPWKAKYNNLLTTLFYNKYNYLSNKKYKWENKTIKFLENGKMNAFGPGEYNFVNKYLVKCNFGSMKHLLKFNEDYSEFTSVRKSDFEVIHGIHL